jgi:hypothetical protein
VASRRAALNAMLDYLSSGQFFTKMDLSSGFHHIRIANGYQHKTAFQTKFGSFEWTVMPSGLTNAPSTFQRTMDVAFKDMTDFVKIYIADIVIF